MTKTTMPEISWVESFDFNRLISTIYTGNILDFLVLRFLALFVTCLLNHQHKRPPIEIMHSYSQHTEQLMQWFVITTHIVVQDKLAEVVVKDCRIKFTPIAGPEEIPASLSSPYTQSS